MRVGEYGFALVGNGPEMDFVDWLVEDFVMD